MAREAILALWLAGWSALGAGCPSSNKSATGDARGARTDGKESTMDDPWQRVKDEAPEGASVGVGPFSAVSVAGFKLYWVEAPGPADAMSGHAVAYQLQGGRMLRREEAMRALLAAGASDPATVALLSLHFLERGGEVVDSPASGPERSAGVAAPRADGDRIVYWYRRRVMNSAELFRATFDPEAVTLASDPVRPDMATDDALVGKMRGLLERDDAKFHSIAVSALVEQCANPAAAALLVETAETHRRPETRVLAIDAMLQCKAQGAVEALVRVLESGSQPPNVRWRAAEVMGQLGGPAARAALEKASRDPDPQVARVAKRALDELK